MIKRLGSHGPATAAALATSHSIHTGNMYAYHLRAHGLATATVFTDHNPYVADLIKCTHLVCVDGHPICDDLISSHL